MMEDLEEISDTATENGKDETITSEHEEGEILTDDGDNQSIIFPPLCVPTDGDSSPSYYPAFSYPGNGCSPSYQPEITIERIVKPLSSEVVIYDDSGRTAIFTSPEKREDSWNASSYARYGKGEPSDRKEVTAKRKSCDYREGKKAKKHKENVKHPKRKSRHKQKLLVDRDKHHSKRRSHSSSSESDYSSSSCSCSCSTSSSSSSEVSPTRRKRGKENKQVYSSDRKHSAASGASQISSSVKDTPRSSTIYLTSDSDKSHSSTRKGTQPSASSLHGKDVNMSSQSSSNKPLLLSHTKYLKGGRSPVRSIYSKERSLRRPSSSSFARSRRHSGRAKTAKGSSIKRKKFVAQGTRKSTPVKLSAEAEVVDLTTSDIKKPPPGSLGEMLLKKTRKGKFKASHNGGKLVIKKVLDIGPSKTPSENHIRDGSNDNGDKILNIGGMEEEQKIVDTIDLDEEDEDELQLRLIALKSSLKILNDVRREGEMTTLHAGSISTGKENDKMVSNITPGNITCSVRSSKCLSQNISSFEDHLLQGIFQRDDAGEFVEFPRSHDCDQGNCSDISSQNANNHSSEADRDLPDSNQDIIDMEICDSSPEEDYAGINDVLQEVGEDIVLDDQQLIKNQVEENFNQDSYKNDNFQMPVEWAYMMPPPPPPDQPDNDISNIDSWCYDQNLYLQSMQSAPHCNSDGAAQYDSSQTHMSWSHTVQSTNSKKANYDLGSNMGGESSSIFSHEQSFENEHDITSNLLNLPKATSLCIAEVLDKCEENQDMEFAGQESLKDKPAHHYQAFMNAVNAVLHNQSSPFTPKQERNNLIKVNLVKIPSDTNDEQINQSEKSPNLKMTNNGRTLVKVNMESKLPLAASAEKIRSGRAAARKRRKERRKLEKQKAKENELSLEGNVTAESNSLAETNDMSLPLSQEDDDEDLLRAQLLIDLSRKKMQKEEDGVESPPPAPVMTQVASMQATAIQKMNNLEQGESSPPCSFPSSAESSPRIRPTGYSLSRRKPLQQHQGSPIAKVRKDPRNLSDIGGYGLDPKNSRYDFRTINDPSVRKDMTTFKFPKIKPVIINLNSDSSDDDSHDANLMSAGASCSKKMGSPARGIISENKNSSLISSVDSLLKFMRAKSTPSTLLPGRSDIEGGALASARPSVNSTPNAVLHLSRRKQVEYHLLKKQIKEKEKLQQARLQQQKRSNITTKKLKVGSASSKSNNCPSRNSPSTSIDQESISSCDKEKTIAVTSEKSKEDVVGRDEEDCSLEQETEKSSPSTILVTDDSVAEEEKSSPLETEADALPSDDDEEMLRMMVLQSIPKRVEKSNADKVVNENTDFDRVSVHASKPQLPEEILSNEENHKLVAGTNAEIGKEKTVEGMEIQEGGSIDSSVESALEGDSPKSVACDVGNSTVDNGIQKKNIVTDGNFYKAEASVEEGIKKEVPKKSLGLNPEIKRKARKRTSSRESLVQNKNPKVIDKRPGNTEDAAIATVSISAPGGNKGVAITTKRQSIVDSGERIKSPTKNQPYASKESKEFLSTEDDVTSKIGTGKPQGKFSKEGKVPDELTQKKMKILEAVKRKYLLKRNHVNEVIMQLAVLVQEATDEERQRQTLKQNIVKLRSQLEEMESQFETQSGLLKSKMERIRTLQNQVTEDRQVIRRLETKGEMLGKQVLGRDFTFDSKRKQILAKNINALRQQMRDVCNKNKAKLQSATLSSRIQTRLNNKVLGRMNGSSIQGKVEVSSKGGGSTVVTNTKGNINVAVKTSLQDEEMSVALGSRVVNASDDLGKCKAVSSKGPVVKKVAKRVEPSINEALSSTPRDLQETCGQHEKPPEEMPLLEGEKKLDEMNELCPYDLLGRCNDDSCIYQHLSQPHIKRSFSGCSAIPDKVKTLKDGIGSGVISKAKDTIVQCKTKSSSQTVANCSTMPIKENDCDTRNALACIPEKSTEVNTRKIDTKINMARLFAQHDGMAIEKNIGTVSIRELTDAPFGQISIEESEVAVESDEVNCDVISKRKYDLASDSQSLEHSESELRKQKFGKKSDEQETAISPLQSEFDEPDFSQVDQQGNIPLSLTVTTDSDSLPSSETENVSVINSLVFGNTRNVKPDDSVSEICLNDAQSATGVEKGIVELQNSTNSTDCDVIVNSKFDVRVQDEETEMGTDLDSSSHSDSNSELSKADINSAVHSECIKNIELQIGDRKLDECSEDSDKSHANDNVAMEKKSSSAIDGSEEVGCIISDLSITRKSGNSTDGDYSIQGSDKTLFDDDVCITVETEECMHYKNRNSVDGDNDSQIPNYVKCDLASENDDSDFCQHESKSLEVTDNVTEKTGRGSFEVLEDVASADAKQCNSSVKSCQSSAKQRRSSRQRQSLLSSPSVTCRRGRSRTSSNNSSTGVEGNTSPGKTSKISNIHQAANCRGRKTRGRGRRGRRGSR